MCLPYKVLHRICFYSHVNITMNFQVFFSVFISSFGGVLFQFITFVTCVFFWRLSNHIENSIGKTPENYAIPTACCCMGKNVTDPKCAKKTNKQKKPLKLHKKAFVLYFQIRYFIKTSGCK